MKRFITIVLTLLLACSIYAQKTSTANKKKKKGRTVSIYGNVDDSFTKAKLAPFITVMRQDSSVVDTVTCRISQYSAFSWYDIRVPREEAKYIIKASLEGYEDCYTDYEVKNIGRKSNFQVPRILMKRKQRSGMDGKELNELVVRGTRVQIAYKGDTIVYDAAAFNLPEGSMLDGLIRQLPGAEIKDNGDIYVNGEKIDNLTLNGKDFFKGDNKVMLENLPYFTVKNIQVYHKSTEKSEMAGRDIEAKEFVMDVNLKREYAHGYIANAEAGAGTEQRWMGRAFGLFYNDHTRISAFVNMNNLNENRTPGSDGEWKPANMSRGLLATRQTGLSIQTEDKDKNVRENFDAKLTWVDADNITHTASEKFASGGSIFGGSHNMSRSDAFGFSITNNLRLTKLKLSSFTYINYYNSDDFSSQSDSTFNTTAQINRSTNLSKSLLRRLHISEHLYWHKALNNGDYFMVGMNGNYTSSKPNETFRLMDTRYATGMDADRRNSYTDNHSDSYSMEARTGYGLSLPDNWTIGLALSGRYEKENEHSNYHRLDLLDNDMYETNWLLPSTRDSLYMVLDGDNSHTHHTSLHRYAGDLRIERYNDKMSFTASFPITNTSERMHYIHSTLDTVARRALTAFEPEIQLYTYGKNPMNFIYSLDVRQPDYVTIMPVLNNTDPLNIRINNPNLKSRIQHKSTGRITFKNDSIGSSVYVGFEFMALHNSWGTRTIYNSQTGAYTSMNDNVNGTWSGSVNGGWQRPIDKAKRLRFDISGSVKYERSVDFDIAYDVPSDALSKVTNIYTRLNGKLSYKLNKLSAAVISKLIMRNSTGDRAGFESINTYDYQYGGNIQYTIPVLELTVATDINMYCRRGYNSSMMNTDDLVWNAQFTRSLCKGRITAKLQAFDLLHSLSNVRYNINAQGRTETWYNCIPRYVMLTAAYKFTKKPNKK